MRSSSECNAFYRWRLFLFQTTCYAICYTRWISYKRVYNYDFTEVQSMLIVKDIPI